MDDTRPKFKDIELSGRQFRLRKFPAQRGGYLAIKVAGILAPVFDMLAANQGIEISQVIAPVLGALSKLSEADFVDIQNKSLRVCFEILPAGEIQVLNSEGHLGVTGLDDDAMTCLALMVQALVFNLSGFSTGSLSFLLPEGLLTKSQSAQT
jgi:hypothetical protein